MSEDYYSVLGVLPDAEDIVIRAAYRALAQRYHPDRWTGDQSVANERMARINRAFEIIGDPKLRSEYDRTRERTGRSAFSEQAEEAPAFDEAMSEAHERWEIACSVYPDLEAYRTRLAKISSALAFAYVASLLETRLFRERASLADGMEQSFLEAYFGSNERILEFARQLILQGARPALLRLNQIIDVLGFDIEAEDVIRRIDSEFPSIRTSRERAERAHSASRVSTLVEKVLSEGNYADAAELATRLGFRVTERQGFLSETKVEVISPQGKMTVFPSKSVFVGRVKVTLCRMSDGDAPSIELP